MLTIVPWPHANLNKDWCLKKLSIEFKERGKRVRNLWWEIYLMCEFENFDTFDFGSWIQETKSLRIARITKTTFLSQKSFQVTDIERLHWHFWRMAQKKKRERRYKFLSEFFWLNPCIRRLLCLKLHGQDYFYGKTSSVAPLWGTWIKDVLLIG